MKFEYQDIIDNYIQGKLTAEELDAFEKTMASNKEIFDQVIYTKNIKRLISSREDKLNKMRLWAEEGKQKDVIDVAAQKILTGTHGEPIDDNIKQIITEKNKKGRVLFWVSGIAAILVLGFFVINPMSFEDNKQSLPNSNFGGGSNMFENMNSGGNIPMKSPVENNTDTLFVDSLRNK